MADSTAHTSPTHHQHRLHKSAREDGHDRRNSHRDRDDRDDDRRRDRDGRREGHRDKERDGHRHRTGEKESSRQHKERDETEEERRDRKRAKREDKREKREERHERREERHERRQERKGGGVTVEDDDLGMWVEKGIDADDAIANIPTADSLPLRSNVATAHTSLPASTTTSNPTQERDAWMLESDAPPPPARATRDIPHSASVGIDDGADQGDLFSSMGVEHKRKDPLADKPAPAQPAASYNELNTQLKEGKGLDEYAAIEKKKAVPGAPGHQWRMMKLKRMYEQATETGRPVEEVAMERYGSMEDFQEALDERKFLDERDSRRLSRRGTSDGGPSTPSTSGMRTPGGAGEKRYMFSGGDEGYFSRPTSRAGFRRPGEEVSTPAGAARVAQLQRQESGVKKAATPIPSVFTPVLSRGTSAEARAPAHETPSQSTTSRPLGVAELNRMQAAVLRAKLSDDPGAQEMEDEYEYERLRYEGVAGGEAGMYAGGADGVQGQMGREDDVQVLPTLDGRGRLYDVGQAGGAGGDAEEERRPGNRRRKKDNKFESRDKQGNLLRYNEDDDEQTLGELVRQERFGGGSADQKVQDAEYANAIARDAKFDSGHDYMDENAERLARRKMKSDALKRQFAINDFARTKKALDECPFCHQEERNPLTAVVALGTRAYMCCTLTEELVPGHCLIVPIQHYMSSLEMDDEEWEEVKNFMKCLMRMHAKNNHGVLFFETILSHRQQRHTYIEAVPIPSAEFADCPAYFRESILAAESEWSQHKKLIDFAARPGGFRRALVPNLPYFAVMWDYKGEKGYGHVIEGDAENAGRAANEEGEGGVYEGDKGGNSGFPPYFAGEIIGNILDLAPRKWMRPRVIDRARNLERARELGTKFQPYNWTLQLTQG